MNNKWFKLGAMAAVAAMAGAIAFSNGVAAQNPTPTQMPNGMGGYGAGMMARGHFGGVNSPISIAAQTLDMSQADLVAAVNGGKTIADVAKEKGVALDTIVDAILAPRAQMMQNAVSAGRMTQEQVDAALATMKTNMTAQLNDTSMLRNFVDSNGDGMCDNMGTYGQAGLQRGPQSRGGRWSK